MEQFLQGAALVLVAVILSLVVSRRSGEIGLLLSLCVCCLVCAGAVAFLEPVVDFLREVRELGSLDSDFLTILLKAAGIGMISELVGLICADSGQSAMGKALQMLANGAVLWVSLPLLRQLLELMKEVLWSG